MHAELASLPPGRHRWAFAAGCLRAAATRPVAFGRLGYPVLAIAILAATVTTTATIGYAPLRWGVVTTIAVLVALAWWGRHARPLGPVAPNPTARLVRAGACLFVGGLTTMFALRVGSHGQPEEQARNGVPLFAVLLTSYLLGFLTLTAQRAATTRTLATGTGTGFLAAMLWLVPVVASPPIPADTTLAWAFTILAAGAAAWANTGTRGGPAQALLACLCSATTAQLLIFAEVRVLSSYGPARLIPDLVPMALTPADDLANSRIELNDPYVALLFLAGLTALTLTAASITTRRQPHTTDQLLTATPT